MLEKKEDLAERVSDAIVSSMGNKQLRDLAWDMIFNEMVDKSWEDLLAFAEDYSLDHLSKPHDCNIL
jgi:hypothetical protein